MKVNHSKYKNTGLLFESLVKQITSDTLSGVKTPAPRILKKYFVNTEIGKEYKLYEFLFKNTSLSETKAKTILDTTLESSKNLNRRKLKQEKYNLIKELKEHYNVEDLFKTQILNYKEYAALYTLMEIYNSPSPSYPQQIVNNKLTLLEYLSNSPIGEENVKNNLLKEFEEYDKDLRMLTYRILLEKFNTKYENLNISQRRVIKEFISSIDSSPNLREFYNKEVKIISRKLKEQIKGVNNKIYKIKLLEVSNLIVPLNKNIKIKNEDLINLLQYYTLIEELKLITNSK